MSAYTPASADVACQNFALVVHIAKKFRTTGIPLDDLVGEGSVGLVRGLRSHDPALGALSAHLAVSITNAILDALRRWKPWRQLAVGEDGLEVEPADEHGEAPDEHLDLEDDREQVERLLAILDGRRRQAVMLYFGLDGEGERTLAEVGAALGVSRQRARQLLESAVVTLRRGAGQEAVYGPPRTYRKPGRRPRQPVAVAAVSAGG
jgi:RNA polymerase sporulation-specific sigma factor